MFLPDWIQDHFSRPGPPSVSGIVGNGQSALLRALAGLEPFTGSVTIGSTDHTSKAVRMTLEEGTLGVDPNMHKTNDGKMPPVIHVDTDAPLYSDVDGRLLTDKLWGLYYKPDFNFGGVQGGSSPYKVDQDADSVAVEAL